MFGVLKILNKLRGDGGLVSTNNKKLAKKIRQIAGLGFKTITETTGRIRVDKDKFQNPNWTRFSEIGYNFRINQMAAAVCLGQIENFQIFYQKKNRFRKSYKGILKNSKFFKIQSELKNKQHTYYTFSAKYLGNNYGVPWEVFRKKYGIRRRWNLCSLKNSFTKNLHLKNIKLVIVIKTAG